VTVSTALTAQWLGITGLAILGVVAVLAWMWKP